MREEKIEGQLYGEEKSTNSKIKLCMVNKYWFTLIIILICLITMISTAMITYSITMKKNFNINDSDVRATGTSLILPSKEDFEYMMDNSDKNLYVKYMFSVENTSIFICQGYALENGIENVVYFYDILCKENSSYPVEITFDDNKIIVNEHNSLGILARYPKGTEVDKIIQFTTKNAIKKFDIKL